jgi:hypothetical protein
MCHLSGHRPAAGAATFDYTATPPERNKRDCFLSAGEDRLEARPAAAKEKTGQIDFFRDSHHTPERPDRGPVRTALAEAGRQFFGGEKPCRVSWVELFRSHYALR